MLSRKTVVYCLYLLRVHRRCADGVDDHHAGTSVTVDEVSSIALPQTVHHARLVQVEQSRQVLWAVIGWRVRLGEKGPVMNREVEAGVRPPTECRLDTSPKNCCLLRFNEAGRRPNQTFAYDAAYTYPSLYQISHNPLLQPVSKKENITFLPQKYLHLTYRTSGLVSKLATCWCVVCLWSLFRTVSLQRCLLEKDSYGNTAWM